jgi:hypothetical protein
MPPIIRCRRRGPFRLDSEDLVRTSGLWPPSPRMRPSTRSTLAHNWLLHPWRRTHVIAPAPIRKWISPERPAARQFSAPWEVKKPHTEEAEPRDRKCGWRKRDNLRAPFGIIITYVLSLKNACRSGIPRPGGKKPFRPVVARTECPRRGQGSDGAGAYCRREPLQCQTGRQRCS